jgi:hypothetical protein
MDSERATVNRRGLRCLLLVAAIAASVSASTSLADSGGTSDPDENGARQRFDIKYAGHGHTDTGKLTQTIKVYGTLAAKRDWQEWDYGFNLRSCYQPVDLARVFTDPKSDTRATLISKSGAKEIEVRRLNDHTLRFVFGEGAIGNPDCYGWDAQAFGDNSYLDRAPNSGVLIYHYLD